jgi:molybdenum cofactor cytidylyltransferase
VSAKRTGQVGAVLLAAGVSRRMGGPNKLLLAIEGEPLVRRAARTLLASKLGEIIVVLGHQSEAVAKALEGLDLRHVVNPDYAQGQASSVRVGVEALGDSLRGIMVCLADQPSLTPADIDFLIEAFSTRALGRILVPVRQGQRGNPVVFDAAFRPRILAEDLNFGCRRLMERHPDLVVTVEAPSDHFLRDVDTIDDAAALAAASTIR